MERLRDLADVLAKQEEAEAAAVYRMETTGDAEGLSHLSHTHSRVLIAVQSLEEAMNDYGRLVGVPVPQRPSIAIRYMGGEVVR